MKLNLDFTSFYSRLVRLKQEYSQPLWVGFPCFYSRLVRLKPPERAADRLHEGRFLFQIGAIKTQDHLIAGSWFIPVSIPDWCD